MTIVSSSLSDVASPRPGRWQDLAERVLEGHTLSRQEGLDVLRCGDEELLDLLAAAYRVRHRWFGNRVHLNFLINARCGACSEDCGYCSQAKVSQADVPSYGLVEMEQLLAGAAMAAQRRAGTYCIVTSGLRPSQRDLDAILAAVARIKAGWGLKICVSLGLLTAEQAQRLKAGGVDRVNHNLNTSRRFYPHICTTHSYQDRLDTLWAVRRAGLEICSGGIVGMGEDDADVVDLALELAALGAEAVPINFLLPIPGIGLERRTPGKGTVPFSSDENWDSPPVALDPRYCLKALSLMRFANPRGELRIAAGREVHLGCLQPLGLYPANSIFVGDYLTEKGQPPEADFAMIRELGFEVVVEG
jgi:biotin synthase